MFIYELFGDTMFNEVSPAVVSDACNDEVMPVKKRRSLKVSSSVRRAHRCQVNGCSNKKGEIRTHRFPTQLER